MITQQEVTDTIRHMRCTGSDTQRVEVKESVHDLPKSLAETISAFSNLHGGTIILGLSEKQGFKPAKGFNISRIYSQLQTIGDSLTPPVRMEIEKINFEGHTLLVAQVPELSPGDKPCFITTAGRYQGAFIRSSDGDRHLTPYEVDRLSEGHRQPHFDIEPVEQATVEDLDQTVLTAILKRARDIYPRSFAKLSDDTILIHLGVLTRVDGIPRPTLAGLLAAGTFPQQYFPRLQLTFTVYPGTTKAQDPETGKRYINSREIVGSIPDILIETLALVQERMNTGAIIKNGLRKDIPDYPLVAVREAVANALQHRDYSPEGRGTHVEVNLYSDCLEITNPGGLYGATTLESLGKEGLSSSRNEFLSRLLTYTPYQSGYVVENKGTGFITIESSLAEAHMPPPIIKNSLTFFRLTLKKRHDSEKKQNVIPAVKSSKHIEEAIINILQSTGTLSARELTEMYGISRVTATKLLRNLIDVGIIEALEARNSPKQRYRLKQKN